MNQAPAPTDGAAAATGPRVLEQTVHINTSIKGGLFDADAVKKIAEITRQELRKLTAEAIA